MSKHEGANIFLAQKRFLAVSETCSKWSKTPKNTKANIYGGTIYPSMMMTTADWRDRTLARCGPHGLKIEKVNT